MDRERIRNAVFEALARAMGLASTEGLDEDTKLSALTADANDLRMTLFLTRRLLHLPPGRTLNDREFNAVSQKCSHISGICDTLAAECPASTQEPALV